MPPSAKKEWEFEMEGNGKVIDHPNRRLLLKIEEQQKQIQALVVDVGVLRDLLIRSIRIMAKYEKAGVLKLPNNELLAENALKQTIKSRKIVSDPDDE